MALDLSALDEKDEPKTGAAASNGQPIEVDWDLLESDPDQPRFEWDEAYTQEFSLELKKRGMMQAINVRPLNANGKYRIIQGEQRYRSGKLVLPKAPIVIRDDEAIYDDYSQVAENVKRKGLTPFELATFIQKRIGKGDKKKLIAENIGMNASDLTYHLALIESPPYILELYKSGKCQTPRYIWDLKSLAEKFPVEVELFCGESEDFTGRAINAFSDSLKKPNNKGPEDSTKLDLDKRGGSGEGLGGGGSGSSEEENEGAGNAGGSQEGEKAAFIPSHDTDNEKETKEPKEDDPTKIKKPLMLCTYDKRDAMVMLYKRPTSPGLIFIKYEDNGDVIEIETGKLKNLTLLESRAP